MDVGIDRDQGSDLELVQALVRRAVCCPCPHPTRITIAYQRSTSSERVGLQMLEQLRAKRHDILVHMEPGGGDVRLDPTARHSCVVFDALDGTLR